MKSSKDAAILGALAVLLFGAVCVVSAQLRLVQPRITGTNTIRFQITGVETNQAYRVLFSPDLAAGAGGWAEYATCAVGQAALEVTLPTNRAGFFRVRAIEDILTTASSGSTLPLPLKDLPTNTAATVSNYAAANLETIYSSTAAEEKYFRGVFSPASSMTRLAIHSDDGATVRINGDEVVGAFGAQTHLEDLNSSFTYISYSFTNGGEYCVEIDYKNNAYTSGDKDGVTLYAYDGGGSASENVIVRGASILCLGSTTTLTAECGSGGYTLLSR